MYCHLKWCLVLERQPKATIYIYIYALTALIYLIPAAKRIDLDSRRTPPPTAEHISAPRASNSGASCAPNIRGVKAKSGSATTLLSLPRRISRTFPSKPCGKAAGRVRCATAQQAKSRASLVFVSIQIRVIYTWHGVVYIVVIYIYINTFIASSSRYRLSCWAKRNMHFSNAFV